MPSASWRPAQQAAQEHGEQLKQSAQDNAQQVREQSPLG